MDLLRINEELINNKSCSSKYFIQRNLESKYESKINIILIITLSFYAGAYYIISVKEEDNITT